MCLCHNLLFLKLLHKDTTFNNTSQVFVKKDINKNKKPRFMGGAVSQLRVVSI
jgi:hypothetical protein